MAFHPVTLTTEVNVRYSINAQDCENVIHYKWNSTTRPSTAELLSLAQEVYQTIGQRLMTMMHTGCVMREVYARNIDFPTANQATYTQSPPIAGARAGSKIPNQVAKSVEKKTGLTGRSHHGGFRVSGFDIAEIDRDLITNTAVTLFTNLMLSLIATRVSGRFIPEVASKTLGDGRVITSLAIPNTIVGSTDSRTQTP